MNKRGRYSIYLGVSYFPVLDRPWIQRLWKRFCCPRGWHLFDEVLSSEGHYLSCDACDLELHLKGWTRYPDLPSEQTSLTQRMWSRLKRMWHKN